MGNLKLLSLGSAMLCAAMTAGFLVAAPKILPQKLIYTDAQIEEALLFEEEGAQWFGEEPKIGTSLELDDIEPNSGSGSVAVILKDGAEMRLHAGDEVLAPCLRLTAIYDDSVLLDDCGGFRLLSLSGDDSRYETKLASAAQVARKQPFILDYRDNRPAAELLQDYRDRLYRKPLSLRGSVNVKMSHDTSGRRVFYIYPGRDERLFDLLPFQKGDKIEAINGIRLGEEEALTSVYEDLAKANLLTVTVQRGEQNLVVLLGL